LSDSDEDEVPAVSLELDAADDAEEEKSSLDVPEVSLELEEESDDDDDEVLSDYEEDDGIIYEDEVTDYNMSDADAVVNAFYDRMEADNENEKITHEHDEIMLNEDATLKKIFNGDSVMVRARTSSPRRFHYRQSAWVKLGN
jgi:hypothetical protein